MSMSTISCTCHVGDFGFEVCDNCEFDAQMEAQEVGVAEPMDLYGGDADVQEWGDGW